MTPSRVKRCSVEVESIPTRRATGTPLSVTTISSPDRTWTSQLLRWDRSSVIETFMIELYITGLVKCTV